MEKDKYFYNRQLDAFLTNLPSREDKMIACGKIRKACMISPNKLYNFRKSKSELGPLFRKTIENALDIKIFTD